MTQKKSFLQRLVGFIWGAAKTVWALFTLGSIVLLLVMIWGAFGGSAKKIENNVALVLWPSGTLVEQNDQDSGTRFFEQLSGEPPSQTLLRDLTDALEFAADDERIPLVVLKLDTLANAGLPQLEELVAAMKKFQASGKPIYAYSADYSQAAYFIAAQADEVLVDPLGSVFLDGFGVYNNYFKDALDKLGVQVHVFRVGEFKAAVEPYLRNDMSEEAKLANREWLGDLWRSYGAGVSKGRKLKEGATDEYVNGYSAGLVRTKGDLAAYAKEAGFVSGIETLADFRKRVGAKVGIDESHGSFRQIHFHDYLNSLAHESRKDDAPKAAGKLGLVVVQGEIVDGNGGAGEAGGDSISDLLEDARRDKEVKGVLLRVDSPGGSVWASEKIRRGVQALRADGKPVVVSMSSVAASGGYWISMEADQIWAHDSTITGSIGIFGLIPTIEKPLEKFGIHTDGVGTTPLSGAFRIDRALSPLTQQLMQSQIEKGYRDFIEGVAKGRKIPVEKVDQIARGRVWSGQRALELGLVDHLGGLEEAGESAAKLAGLDPENYDLEEFQSRPMFSNKLLGLLGAKLAIKLDVVPGIGGLLQQLASRTDVEHILGALNDPKDAYAYCLCTPSIGNARP